MKTSRAKQTNHRSSVKHAFRSILGVDQTGAVGPRGKPRPLHAACFTLSNSTLRTNLRLDSLTRAAVEQLVGKDGFPVLVMVDSVLGLPDVIGIDIRELIHLAARYRFGGKEFGAIVANEFFLGLLANSDPDVDARSEPFPERRAEKMAGANSVFRLKPFQRNIGCGSFRVLKDLGSQNIWYRVWPQQPFDPRRNTIVEGYPSLLWKILTKSSSRDIGILVKWLAAHHPEALAPRSLDAADACVLALGGHKLLGARYFEQTRSPVMRREGWIAGLEVPESPRQWREQK